MTVTIRPDHIELLNEGDGVLSGEILVRTFIGKAYQYEVKTEVGVLLVNNPAVLEVGTKVSQRSLKIMSLCYKIKKFKECTH